MKVNQRSSPSGSPPGSAGQVVIEYLLTIVVAIAVATTIATVFRRTVFKLWEFYARQISAACPGCPADDKIRIKGK